MPQRIICVSLFSRSTANCCFASYFSYGSKRSLGLSFGLSRTIFLSHLQAKQQKKKKQRWWNDIIIDIRTTIHRMNIITMAWTNFYIWRRSHLVRSRGLFFGWCWFRWHYAYCIYNTQCNNSANLNERWHTIYQPNGERVSERERDMCMRTNLPIMGNYDSEHKSSI